MFRILSEFVFCILLSEIYRTYCALGMAYLDSQGRS